MDVCADLRSSHESRELARRATLRTCPESSIEAILRANNRTAREILRAVVTASVLIVAALVVGSPCRSAAKELVAFELEDQFGRVHRHSDVLGTIVLLNGADRVGSRFTGVWGKAIREALGDHPAYDQISHLAYADLRGLPFFMKGFVRKKFPQDPERWVLIDWKGVLAKTYDFTPKACNVLVFSSDGSLVRHESGQEPEAESVRRLVEALRGLLDQAAAE